MSVQPLARHDMTESLKLHIKFPSRPSLPTSSICLSHRTPHPHHPREHASRVEAQSLRDRLIIDIGLIIADAPMAQADIQEFGGAKPVRACSFHEVG